MTIYFNCQFVISSCKLNLENIAINYFSCRQIQCVILISTVAYRLCLKWGLNIQKVYVPPVVSTPQSFPHSWHITGFVARVTRRVSLMEQELLTLPVHLSWLPVFSGVRVTGSLVLYVMFCRSLFVILYFFFRPLCCLSFDLRTMITPLVSSNSSLIHLVYTLIAYSPYPLCLL